MKSSRNRIPEERVLAAARACVLDYGIRRTSFGDIARRARVSRMTLYRLHADRAALLGAVMAREFNALLDNALRLAASRPTARARLVEATVGFARAIATNDIFVRVLESEPELVAPYVLDRLGRVQRRILVELARHLQEGQSDGSVRSGRVPLMAALVEHAVRSVVFSVRASERAVPLGETFDELALMIDLYLRPLQASQGEVHSAARRRAKRGRHRAT